MERTIYVVRSETRDNKILDEFDTFDEAVEFATSNIRKKPYIEARYIDDEYEGLDMVQGEELIWDWEDYLAELDGADSIEFEEEEIFEELDECEDSELLFDDYINEEFEEEDEEIDFFGVEDVEPVLDKESPLLEGYTPAQLDRLMDLCAQYGLVTFKDVVRCMKEQNEKDPLTALEKHAAEVGEYFIPSNDPEAMDNLLKHNFKERKVEDYDLDKMVEDLEKLEGTDNAVVDCKGEIETIEDPEVATLKENTTSETKYWMCFYDNLDVAVVEAANEDEAMDFFMNNYNDEFFFDSWDHDWDVEEISKEEYDEWEESYSVTIPAFKSKPSLTEGAYDFENLANVENIKAQILDQLETDSRFAKYLKDGQLSITYYRRNPNSYLGYSSDETITDFEVASSGIIYITLSLRISRDKSNVRKVDLETVLKKASRNTDSYALLKAIKEIATNLNKSHKPSLAVRRDKSVFETLTNNPEVAEELKDHVIKIEYRIPLLDKYPEEFFTDKAGDPLTDEATRKLEDIYKNFSELPFADDVIDAPADAAVTVKNRPAGEDVNRNIEKSWAGIGSITFDCPISDLSQEAQSIIAGAKLKTDLDLKTDTRTTNCYRLANALIRYYGLDTFKTRGTSLKEHVNKECSPIESDQKLNGTDNAVVDCEVADVIAHSEDEKPVDCEMKKAPLVKPLTEGADEEVEEVEEVEDTVEVSDDTVVEEDSAATPQEPIDIEEIKDDLEEVKDKLDDAEDYEEFINTLKDIMKNPAQHKALAAVFDQLRAEDTEVEIDPDATVPVKDLIPTQSEIDVDGVLSGLNADSVEDACAEPACQGNMPIVLNGKYILDGHHRWCRAYALNKDGNIAVINCDFGADADPLEALKKIQTAVAATEPSDELPSEDTEIKANIYTMEDDDIKDLAGSCVSDECAEKIKEVNPDLKDQEAICDYITKNCIDLKNCNQPIEGAQPRWLMPQITEEAVEAVEKGILTEEVDENGFTEFDEPTECEWCGGIFSKDQLRKEVDLGYLCSRCEAAIKSRGEKLTFEENTYFDDLYN